MNYVIKGALNYANNLSVVFVGRDGQPYLIEQHSTGAWRYVGNLPHDSQVTTYDDIAIASGKNNDVQLILLGNGKLYRTQQDHSTGHWTYKYELSNPLSLTFTAVASGLGNSGTLEILALADGHPYRIPQDAASGGFNVCQKLSNTGGLQFNHLAIGPGSDGHLRVILLDTNGQPYVLQQHSDGSYTDPVAMDNPNSVPYASLCTVASSDGTLNILLRSSDGDLYLIKENADSLGGTNIGPIPYHGLELSFIDVAAALGHNGTPLAVCLGKDGQPYLIQRDLSAIDSNQWPFRGPLPTHNQIPKYQALTAVVGADGNLQVICLTSECQPYLIWQDRNSGNWSYYGPVPYVTQINFISAVLDAGNNDNTQVICLGDDGRLYLKWQDAATRAWCKFDLLTPSGDALPTLATDRGNTALLAMARGHHGDLQLICIGHDGRPYLICQDHSSGTWSHRKAWSAKWANCTSVAVGVGNGGNLQALLGGNAMYLVWQDHATGVWTQTADYLRSYTWFPAGAIATANSRNGCLQVICGGMNALSLVWQYNNPGDSNDGRWYTDYGVLPLDDSYGAVSSVAAGMGADGNVQVACLGKGKNPTLMFQDRNTGAWDGSYGLLPVNPVPYAAMAMCHVDRYNQLRLYLLGEDGQLYETVQVGSDWLNQGLVWPGRYGLHVPAAAIACGNAHEGGALVILLGKSDGRAYFFLETSLLSSSSGLLE